MNTPKVSKRVSLSLKRLNGGNQSIVLNGVDSPCSPSIKSICTEVNFQTPPHRKLSWDENTDYSPQLLDSSFSPSALLSQSLAVDSPEVGWRWSEETPDSAYTDSSYTSTSCSSVESKTIYTRGDAQRQRHAHLKREEQRRSMEIEMRRAEKMRVDELLKKRCAKFQEHLRAITMQCSDLEEKDEKSDKAVNTIRRKSNEKANTMVKGISTNLFNAGINSLQTSSHTTTIDCTTPTRKSTENIGNDTFSEFLNDSDSDCLLIEATQQVESKIVEPTENSTDREIKCLSSTSQSSMTPTSSNKEKRSSFYMKFLEDDNNDDWFDSLDDVIREATQAKKPRKSLQRHYSMPVTKTTSYNADSGGTHTMTTTTSSVQCGITNLPTTATSSTISATTESSKNNAARKIKRHSSSQALSPGCSSYRRNNLHSSK